MDNQLEKAGVTDISIPTSFPVGPVNVFLIKDEVLTLVDTGPATDEGFAALEQGLRNAGVAVSDLERILITHGHVDHMGLLARLLANSSAKAYAHPYVVDQWSGKSDDPVGRRRFYDEVLTECGTPEEVRIAALDEWASYHPLGEFVDIQHAVEDGDVVGPYTVYHVPGHSPADTLFVDHARKISFTGDHILEGVSPNPFIRRPVAGKERARSLVEYQESLRRSRAMDLGVCCPGHGTPFRNHRELIDQLLARHTRRAKNVVNLVKERAQTPYEIARTLLPRVTPKDMMLGISVTLGYLELLEVEGRVMRARHDGTIYFRVNTAEERA